MKKTTLLLVCALSYILSSAQTTSIKNLQVTTSFLLGTVKVTAIGTDTGNVNRRGTLLITEKAAKDYTDKYRYVLGKGFVFSGDTVAVSPVLTALNVAPPTSTSTGTINEIRIVNGNLYICVATNTWQRVALSTYQP